MKRIVKLLPALQFLLIALISGFGSNFSTLTCAWSSSSSIRFSGRTRTNAALLAASVDDCDALSPINIINSSSTLVGSRRNALRKTFAIATLAAMSSLFVLSTPIVPPAYADVTNKIASSTALRAMRRTQDQLSTKLLAEAQANNFVGVKARLREPPFLELRKNMLILVRGGEDGPKAQELTIVYKQLIKSLEDIDSTSSLGMRGREIDSFLLGQEYEGIVKALDSFITVAAEAAAIPLQEAPSM